MSAAKHTPGPWSIKDDTVNAIEPDVMAGEFYIAQCFGHSHHDEALANARLIAAAPELLEALQITRGNIASLGPAGALTPYTSYQEWLAMVDAAIAKATGGQNEQD